MIEIKSENGKATGKISGDSVDVLVDLTTIIEAVIEKIQVDVDKTREEILNNIFSVMKNNLL